MANVCGIKDRFKAATLPSLIDARFHFLFWLDASDALVRTIGAKMVFKRALQIITLAGPAGPTYNYCVSRTGERINYNRNNSKSNSPIRQTRGYEKRAILIHPPARLIPAMQDEIRNRCLLKGHDYYLQRAGRGGPGPRPRRRTIDASWAIREMPWAEVPACTRFTRRMHYRRTKMMSRPDGITHFDEECE